MKRLSTLVAVVLFNCFATVSANQSLQFSEQQVWQNKYLTAVDGYTYAFPYVYMELLKFKMTNIFENDSTPYMSMNQFWHLRHNLDHHWQGGGMPNNDTLYSVAWVDVSKEPMILSHPEMPSERYFTFQLAGFDSDNFGYVGKRVTGSAAGSFAIVGPGWQGTLPEGIRGVSHSHTPYVFIVGRTLVKGKEDLPTVHSLQDQYTLVPLSQLGNKDYQVPEVRAAKPAATALAPFKDPLSHWQTIADVIARNKEQPKRQHMRHVLASVGIKPGVDVSELDEETKAILSKAAVDGFAKLKHSIGFLGNIVNGWKYPSKALGRAGKHGEFLLRAAGQSLGGIVANDAEETIYNFVNSDMNGDPLQGSKAYQLYMSKDNLPQAEAFWSLTMYNTDYNFVTNEFKKYSVGDRTEGLNYDLEGGVTFYLQNTPPSDPKKRANWLPTNPEQAFYMLFRSYLPREDVIEQRWIPPSITPAEPQK